MLVCRCTKVTTKLHHCCKYKLREMLIPGSEYNPRTVSTVVKMDLSFKFGIPNEGSNICVSLRYEHRGARLHGWSPACIASSHLENKHPTEIITSTKCKSALVQAVWLSLSTEIWDDVQVYKWRRNLDDDNRQSIKCYHMMQVGTILSPFPAWSAAMEHNSTSHWNFRTSTFSTPASASPEEQVPAGFQYADVVASTIPVRISCDDHQKSWFRD